MRLYKRFSDSVHRYLKIPYLLHTKELKSSKKPKATYIFLHGIGNNLHSWDEVAKRLPEDVRVIGIDLLGFGKSPKPKWEIYSAKSQARSVGLTIAGLGLVRRPVIVGHSLGALVAVEVAKKYPMLASRLILCSPPFYSPKRSNKTIQTDDMLRYIYRVAKRHPEKLARITPLAVKLGLANKELSITDETVGSYLSALESSIINQNSLVVVSTLKLPIDILYGLFDPVVIRKHIVALGKSKDNISIKQLSVGHEIIGRYVTSLAGYIVNLNEPSGRRS